MGGDSACLADLQRSQSGFGTHAAAYSCSTAAYSYPPSTCRTATAATALRRLSGLPLHVRVPDLLPGICPTTSVQHRRSRAADTRAESAPGRFRVISLYSPSRLDGWGVGGPYLGWHRWGDPVADRAVQPEWLPGAPPVCDLSRPSDLAAQVLRGVGSGLSHMKRPR